MCKTPDMTLGSQDISVLAYNGYTIIIIIITIITIIIIIIIII